MNRLRDKLTIPLLIIVMSLAIGCAGTEKKAQETMFYPMPPSTRNCSF